MKVAGRRRSFVAAVALPVALAVAGCTTQTPPSTVATRTATASTTPASTPTRTASVPSPASSPGASPGSSGATSGTVEDASLLEILPATVDGVEVGLEHQAFIDAVADPAFTQHVRRAAFGVAVSGTDLVSGVVAELQPGSFSDAFFRDWRDTYNAGACGQSGGVVGTAEAQIDGRTVHIGTCAGGLRTYHAWLAERGAIVSAFAVGEGRFGEALMEGLRP